MNALRHLQFEKHLFFKKTLPIYVIFFITERCTNRCLHCFLDQDRYEFRQKELTLDEIRKISSSMGQLMILLPTGGEPFLREDLPEIIRIFYDQNKLRYVGMPTSAHDADTVLASVRKILHLCPDLELHIEVSIDGFEQTHNKIRRSNSSYAHAMAAYERLRKLAAEEPRFSVGITSVFSRYNQEELLSFYRYLRDSLNVDQYTLLLARGNPVDPAASVYDLSLFRKLKDELNLDIGKGRIGFSSSLMSRFLQAQRIIRNNLVHDIAMDGRYRSPCHAGRLAGVITANGEVKPCELLDVSFGNLRENDHDFGTLWRGKKARNFVKSMLRDRCFCTHECFVGMNILFNKRYLPEIVYRGLRCHSSPV